MVRPSFQMSHWWLCLLFVIGHAAGLPDSFSRSSTDPSPVRYLLVNTQQRKPMNQTMLAPVDALRAVAEGPIPENPYLKFGISTLFSPLHDGSTEDVNAISELLKAAEATSVPVFIGLDGENWWSQSGLSNWWNPSAPGYNLANRENVEWIAPDGATNDSSVIKISWRNWGRQIRVAPQQNIHSPAVLAATRKALKRTLEPIVSWYQQLAPENRWLLAGVKVGWEASIGWNAFYYPDGNSRVNSTNTSADPHYGLNHSAPGAAWGAQQLGYAAAASAGLVPSGEGGVLTRGDIAALVHMYLGNLTEAAASTGFPLDR